MLEKPSDKTATDDARARPSLPPVAPDEPHTLDLGKLELVQRWSQYAAAVVLVVFVALFVAGSILLNKQIDQIRANDLKIKSQGLEIKANEDKIKTLDKEIATGKTAMKSVVYPNANLLDTKQADQVKQFVESSIDQGDGEKKIAARVYIQIGDEAQRARAAEVVRLLQKRGYIVPGIENVGSKARIPDHSQLRYYQSDSIAQADTKDIITTLREVNIPIQLPDAPNTSSNVRPRHYELWFGKDF